ncbi:MAG: DUF1841 family protein [Gammaproteobacteria bacterium]|nr:MAG: DUF1841 family protein [Gammaproteobacteria bacterium]
MFGQDRNQMRQFFITCWEKYNARQPLEPIEALISSVIAEHPEYHHLIESSANMDKDYSPEDGQTNPFLHMGMHISIREQVQADRPIGIKHEHEKLSAKLGDLHEAEHKMQECLGLILWEAQRNGSMPDEQKYLECVRKLI